MDKNNLYKVLLEEFDNTEKHLDEMGNRCFQEAHNWMSGEENDYDASDFDDDEILNHHIEREVRIFGIMFDCLGLNESRLKFFEEVEAIKKREGNQFKSSFDHRWDGMNCEAQEAIRIYKRAIEGLVLKKAPPKIHELERLNRLLKDTAAHVREDMKGKIPSKEEDVQDSMEKYLRAMYPDFVPKFKLPKPVKCFYPDGGVPSLGVAIEFKFIVSESELKTAISGILEDMNAFEGSKDWRIFYAVLYMTKAFKPQASILEQFSLAKKNNWKIIFVFGDGKRKTKKSKK